MAYSQSMTGNDLLSDLQTSNKNIVYTYWIGIVNGNIQGSEYGIWFTLDSMMKEGLIEKEQKNEILKRLKITVPKNKNEEEIFKIVWKYIDKNPEIRHMQLSELTHMALQEL